MGRKSRVVYVRRRRLPDSAKGGDGDLAGGLALEEARTSRRLIEGAAGSTAATAGPGDERRREPGSEQHLRLPPTRLQRARLEIGGGNY